jgi:hypothetical protein
LLPVGDGLGCYAVLVAVAEGGVDADVLVDFELLGEGRLRSGWEVEWGGFIEVGLTVNYQQRARLCSI